MWLAFYSRTCVVLRYANGIVDKRKRLALCLCMGSPKHRVKAKAFSNGNSNAFFNSNLYDNLNEY